MSFQSSCVFLILLFIGLLHSFSGSALAFQTNPANEVLPNGSASNNSDPSATGTLLSTFVDPSSSQPYGRYMVNETVPVLEYVYQPVTERIYVPVPVTEPKTTSVPEYVPVWTQQLQLQTIPSWNPFAAPQQVWRYVPVCHFQIAYRQVTQNFTYQKYEPKDVTKMVPVVSTQTKQAQKIVDRPLGPMPNGGNALAVYPTNNVMPSNPLVNSPGNPNASPLNSNPYQEAALIAQANRNQSRFATRPIDYPAFPGYPNRNLYAQAPTPYYPSTFNPSNTPAMNGVANPMLASQPIPSPNNTFVIPAVPLRPEPTNSMAGYYGANPNSVYPGTQPQYPYVNTASRPLFNWPSFASGSGSLFGSSLFSNNRNTSYVASNTSASQPYLWGNSNNLNNNYNNYNNSQSSAGFRPNTSPYVAPQQGWGMVPGNNNRDPMQGGMPATVLR